MKRRATWLAIIICVLLVVIPGLLVGAIGSYVYKFSIAWSVGSDPDFFMLRTFFGIATPGLIIKWLMYEGFPSAIHGGVAGALAVLLTDRVYKGANLPIVAYATGTLFTGILLVILGLSVVLKGFDAQVIASIFQLVGLWCGLLSVAASVEEENTLLPS